MPDLPDISIFNYKTILPTTLLDAVANFFFERYEADSYTASPLIPFEVTYWIRVCLVTFSFLFIVTSVLQQELESVVKYLSYWAVWITILALIFSNNAGQWPYPSDETAIDYKILANLFNTTAMITN